jgi:hypothetical protein
LTNFYDVSTELSDESYRGFCYNTGYNSSSSETMGMAQTKRLTSTPDSADITRSILVLRGQRVLLDAELAALYGVETRTLIQAVQRNRARFPADFMFQLNAAEWLALRSQFVISKAGRGGRRYPQLHQGTRQAICTTRSPDRQETRRAR